MLPINYLGTGNIAQDNGKPQRLQRVATQFEAMLVESMLKHSVQKLFSDSQEGEMSEIYGEMWQKQLAGEIATANALGIARQLRASLEKGSAK